MKHDLVLKQKKVLKIVSEYFKRKKNSPFKKKVILHFMKMGQEVNTLKIKFTILK